MFTRVIVPRFSGERGGLTLDKGTLLLGGADGRYRQQVAEPRRSRIQSFALVVEET